MIWLPVSFVYAIPIVIVLIAAGVIIAIIGLTANHPHRHQLCGR